jgi:CubicO group peptidase (beta-lactamase class C family)
MALLQLDQRCSAAAKGSTNQLAVLDTIVEDAIRDGQVPGAVVLIGHNGEVIYRKAFGHEALEPRPEAMTVSTVFDIASLTKVVATTTAVMQLVEKGEIRTNDPVAKYLPEFAQNGKEDITIRQLLTHFSGLPEDLDLTQPWQGRDTALRMAYATQPIYPPGTLHRAGGPGRADIRDVAGSVLPGKNLRAAADEPYPFPAAGFVASSNCADPV